MRGRGSAPRWGKPVTDPRGRLEAWLTEPVQPMLPRPGTFDRVSREARRRRTRRMVLSVAGAATAAAAAAMLVPQLVIPALEGGPATPVSAAHGTSVPGPTAPAGSPAPTPAGTGPAAGPVPAPLSVTFVGMFTGWVLGQNRSAGRCDLAAAAPCLTLARTDTSGASWRPAGPPPAHGPDGATGVSQVRFLNRSDGWAFGPQLWATHDSGRSWTQIATGGMRVTALETRGTRAFAVWAHCTGTGPRFAAHCTGFALYSSPAGSDQWQPVPGAAAAAGPATAGGSAGLLLATSQGIETSADGGANWTLAAGTRPPGGFGYVGMTTASQGFAIPADPGQHAIWFTYDSSQTWVASPVSG